MTKRNGRPPRYGATCCVEGCDAPRYMSGGHYSRFCYAHYREHYFIRRHTVADVCAAWSIGSAAPSPVELDGVLVYALECVGDSYRALLAGADAFVLVRGDAEVVEVLKR